MPGKECRRCNVFKAATEFYRNKTNPDGLYNNCKACFAADAWSRCGLLTSIATAAASVMSGVMSRSLGLLPLGLRNLCWVYRTCMKLGKELEKPGTDRGEKEKHDQL